MTTAIAQDRRAPAAASTGTAVFFSIHELGWKTWARRLEAFSGCAFDSAVHVPVSTPLHVRVLARPLPWPFRRSLVTEHSYYSRIIGGHLERISAGGRISIIIASSQRLAPCLLSFCKSHKVPLAICLDTTGPVYTRDLLRQPPPARWAEEQSIYDFARLLIPWSSWAKNSLVDDFHIPEEKIALSPPGVTIPDDVSDGTHNSAALATAPHKLPNIAFVGNDWQRKGGPRLLEWHQKHFQASAHLHIVSAKAPRKSLPNVTFHGMLAPDKLLAEILPAMDIFCMPTSHDMSPFAIAEAQAAGLPVISSRLAGIPDLVQHNRTGYLFPPNDDTAFIRAIDNLLSIADLRRQMSHAARLHARENLNAAKQFPALMRRLAALTV